MPRILLAHSFFLRFDPKAWKQSFAYPPLGTLYAAGALREAGFEVALFDATFAEDERAFEAVFARTRPDMVLFFEDNFNFLSKMCLARMRRACFTMARHARGEGAFVAAQGSDPVDHLPDYFANGIDAVICGEGEETAVELARAFPDGDLSVIAGLAYPTPDGPKLGPRRPLIRELDSLPFPAWDLADIDAYRAVWMRAKGYFSLNIVTTRGCPFHCNWCAKPVYGQVYHSRSPENVMAEIESLRERFRPDHLWFCDDILGLKPGWLRRFAELTEERNCRIPFSCQTRVDLMLQEDNVRHIAKAGARTVWVGAESGSQHVLDAMEKGTTVAQIHEATTLLQCAGVGVAWFLQFGYLGETAEDIRATVDMVRRGRPDDIGISVSYPLPGTRFYDMVRSRLGKKQNWEDSGDLDLLFPGAFHPSFYRALHRAVHREFRIRQALRAMRKRDAAGADRRRIRLLPWYGIGYIAARISMVIARLRRPLHAPDPAAAAGAA